MTAQPESTPRPRRARYVLHVVSLPERSPAGDSFPAAQMRLVRMLDQVLEAFDTEPRFQHFTLLQTHSLEEYLSIRPEHFERIEEAVQDGKLQVGPWFIQPEAIISTPESLIRNLMIGLRTARVFGPPVLVGTIADTCGAGDWLPQILKGFNIDTAIIGCHDTIDKPLECIGQGNDGTQIVVCFLHEQTAITLEVPIAELRHQLAPYAESGHVLLPHRWTTADSVPAVISAAHATLHDDIFHSTLGAYAKAVQTYARANPSPTIMGILQEQSSSSGRDSDSAAVHVRYFEAVLTCVIEPFCVWLENTNTEISNLFIHRPQRLLEKLWRDFLLNRNTPYTTDLNSRDDVEVRYEHIDAVARLVEKVNPGIGEAYTGPFGIRGIRIITSSDPKFEITATKLPQEAERTGMIVRGHNTTDDPLWVTLTPWRSFQTVDVVTLDETLTGGKLATEPDGAIHFKAAPHHLLTFWFHD